MKCKDQKHAKMKEAQKGLRNSRHVTDGTELNSEGT